MTSKTCIKCGEVKPLTDYYKDRNRKDGKRAACKTCLLARQARYHRANRKVISDYKASYMAEYNAGHPHISWEYGYRQRAERYGFDYLIPSMQSFTREDLVWLHGDKCYHCGGEWDQLDHWPIPVSQGGMHALFNAVPSCADCNRRSWRTAQLTTTTDKDN